MCITVGGSGEKYHNLIRKIYKMATKEVEIYRVTIVTEIMQLHHI